MKVVVGFFAVVVIIQASRVTQARIPGRPAKAVANH